MPTKTFVSALVFSGLAAVSALGISGCGNVDNAQDCIAVCDKYKSCFDSSYNTSSCYDRCRANSDDKSFRDTVGTCHDCIDGKDCTAAGFTCASECGSVVP